MKGQLGLATHSRVQHPLPHNGLLDAVARVTKFLAHILIATRSSSARGMDAGPTSTALSVKKVLISLRYWCQHCSGFSSKRCVTSYIDELNKYDSSACRSAGENKVNVPDRTEE